MAHTNELLANVEKSMVSFLDSFDNDEERVGAIDDLIHRLNFERRLALLSDLEKKDLQEDLSLKERARLDSFKGDPKKFEECLEMIARGRYFRRIDWMNYFNGHTRDKPPPRS